MIEKVIAYKNIIPNAYKIDEFGNVFSLLRNKPLSVNKDKDGYLRTSFQTTGFNKRRSEKIHTIVAFMFIGECPKSMEHPTINHIDENILNNHYNNLEYMEREKNSSIRSNTPKGEKNASSILTEKQVLEICVILEESKIRQVDIAKIYNVERSTISNIKRRKTWVYISQNFSWTIKKVKTNKEELSQKQEVLALFCAGKTIQEVIRLGYAPTTSWRYYKNIYLCQRE